MALSVSDIKYNMRYDGEGFVAQQLKLHLGCLRFEIRHSQGGTAVDDNHWMPTFHIGVPGFES